jgi:hypothetical protein
MFEGNTRDADRPGIEEMYQTASATSDLTATGGDADKGGAVNVIIAAGWSKTRIGMQLLRLHSEFDASEKPNKPTPASIQALVGTFQRRLAREEPKPGLRAPKAIPLTPGMAREYARDWYMHEMGLLFGKLKTLPAAREEVAVQALRWGMGRSDDPITRSELTEARENDAAMLKRMRAAVEAAGEDEEAAAAARATLVHWQAEVEKHRQAERRAEMHRATEKAAAVIRYWLEQGCPSCNGLKWQLIPGTPSLSGRPCKVCGGSGIGAVPHGQDGRKLATFMDSCVEDARGALKWNLSQFRKPKLTK